MPLIQRKTSFASAFAKGLAKWQDEAATPENKLRMRLAIAMNSDARAAVYDYLVEVDAKEATPLFGSIWDGTGIDLDRLEQFLALMIKYLPLILEIILPLFS